MLLRNVHMAPEWLGLLEKRLHRMTPHASFRLFLSAELHPKLPSSLLRQSALVLYEAPKGVKASLLKTLSAGGVLTKARVEAAPAERGRLHFLLAWLHAVIVERRRYAPVGWLKPFEFSENDQVRSKKRNRRINSDKIVISYLSLSRFLTLRCMPSLPLIFHLRSTGLRPRCRRRLGV